MKTDLELQKMLADELPELIEVCNRTHESGFSPIFLWRDRGSNFNEIRIREWPWIISEVEKKLNAAQKIQYTELSASECQLIDWGYYPGETIIDWGEVSELIFLTWQQRAVAYLKTIGKISMIP